MIDLVIPYYNAGAKSDELKFALRSWEKNFTDNFIVVIIGDLPEFVNPDSVIFIPQPRKHSQHCIKCFDSNHKYNTIITSPEISDDFIISYDDIILLKKTNIKHIQQLYAIKPLVSFSSSVYQRIISNTLNSLKRFDFSSITFETHLPRIINKKLMIKTFQKFMPIKNRLAPFTLYFNQHFDSRNVKYLNDHPFSKATFNSFKKSVNTNNDKEFLQKLSHYHFLNFDDSGYNNQLKNCLSSLFPNKSKFEL